MRSWRSLWLSTPTERGTSWHDFNIPACPQDVAGAARSWVQGKLGAGESAQQGERKRDAEWVQISYQSENRSRKERRGGHTERTGERRSEAEKKEKTMGKIKTDNVRDRD